MEVSSLKELSTYTFCNLMNLLESAIISGMVPRTGKLPCPSFATNSFKARTKTQKVDDYKCTRDSHVHRWYLQRFFYI